MKFTYPIYGKYGETFSIDVPPELENCDYFGALVALGFEKKRIGEPYHYVECSDPSVEIVSFHKAGVGSILELWDYNGSILDFFCENSESILEVLGKFTEIMKNLVFVEDVYRRIRREEKEEDE